MKKNLLKSVVILFSISAMFFSCTSENSNPIVEQSAKADENSQIFQRNANEVYEEYVDLFDNLYGTSFDVLNTDTYEQTDGEYHVTKVNLNNNLEGYFVDLPDRNVVYLEHNMSTGNLDYFDYDDVNDNMVLTSYDLTLDSEYDYSPLSPETTPIDGRRPFWGTQTTYGPCVNGVKQVFITHYALWIGYWHEEQYEGNNPANGYLYEQCGIGVY
jgi:hypothetical protein